MLGRVRPVTLADVAQRAGVSTSTVSLYINGKLHRMGPATQQKISDAIDAVGYTMDPIARSLSTGRTMTIGLAWDSSNFDYYFEDIYFMYFAKQVARHLKQREYSVVLFDLDEVKSKFRMVDGLIVKATELTWQTVVSLQRLDPAFPIVSLGKFQEEDVVPSVSVDDLSAGYRAVEFLARKHRRVHLLSFEPGLVLGFDKRVAGARAAAVNLGVELSIEHGEMSEAFGHSVVLRCHRAGCVPEALFCLNDITAIGAMKAARDLDLAVPERMAVMGVDDTPSISYCLGLTTIRHPIGDLAGAAVSTVLDGAGLPHKPPRSTILDTILMARSSA